MELKALKSQINPHFFFNTLNGIYSMSLEKDERLPQTVLQLSHLMRYLLYEAKEDMVPLEKEWQVLQDYISLQKIRSDNNLYIEQKLEGEIKDQKIAPLLLITFMENAFKHGTRTSIGNASMSLWVRVNGPDFNFMLKNRKLGTNEIIESDHKGLGLENVKRRLELIYPGKHQLTISEDPQHFIVNLHLNI
jgi:LytS/YehU family sensor histidine kinase